MLVLTLRGWDVPPADLEAASTAAECCSCVAQAQTVDLAVFAKWAWSGLNAVDNRWFSHKFNPSYLAGQRPPAGERLAQRAHRADTARRQLSGMGLSGKLPLDGQLWSRLASLQDIDLDNNRLSGFVPPQLVRPASTAHTARPARRLQCLPDGCPVAGGMPY
jgi:hypothetical protein